MLDSDLRKLKPETGLWDRSLPHFRLLQSGVGHIALASVGKLSGHTVVMQTHCKIDKGENVDRSNHTALSAEVRVKGLRSQRPYKQLPKARLSWFRV